MKTDKVTKNRIMKALADKLNGKPSKLLKGHLSPAYNRLCITSVQVLDLFNRGLDFENHDPTVRGKYCSIRDFAPGASIQFRYGKRLQKTLIHKLPL